MVGVEPRTWCVLGQQPTNRASSPTPAPLVLPWMCCHVYSHLLCAGISLRIANTNLDKKNFKTTFPNSGNNRNEARRHLFAVLGLVEMYQSSEKTEKKNKEAFLCGWEGMLNFVESGGTRVGVRANDGLLQPPSG